MKNIRLLLIISLLLSLGTLAVLIYQTNHKKRLIKEDLIEISDIKYGLFNVDEWRDIVSEIIAKKIDELEVQGKDKVILEKKIADFLKNVIHDFEKDYYDKNRDSFSGIIKNIGASAFDIFGSMKIRIPKFSKQIVEFLDDPENKKNLKAYITAKINEYAENTFSEVDYSAHNAVLKKYPWGDRPATIAGLRTLLNDFQEKSNIYKYILAVIAVITAVFIFFSQVFSKMEFILLTLVCLLFLVLGLTLPMIEIDARISDFKISLLGEQINFQQQVIYYKSKSIIEVIQLMIQQGGFDLLMVGLLVFIFSVLFPLSKLITSVCMVLLPRMKSNKLALFLVYKTGKWSMADVMVVAIFMAYIGFSGILTEQLSQIEGLSSKVEVLTTNQSSIQIGFFAFTAFALLSLLLNKRSQKTLAP